MRPKRLVTRLNIFAASAINWGQVRTLSRLSMLNRLVFTMLVIVPLITAFWPIMVSTTGRYNRVVSTARQQFGLNPNGETETIVEEATEEEAEELTKMQKLRRAGTRIMSLGSQSPLFSLQFDAFVVDVFPKPIDSPKLPRTWALAFFAALSILLGDTFVQLFCPPIVRQQSRDEFVAQQKRDFAAAPSKDSLLSCLAAIQKISPDDETAAEAADLVTAELAWQLDYEQRTAAIEEAIDITRQEPSNVQTAPTNESLPELLLLSKHLHEKDSSSSNAIFRRRVSIVDLGCKLQYTTLSRKYTFAILLSMLCYMTGCAIVCRILFEQSGHVARAAGWI